MNNSVMIGDENGCIDTTLADIKEYLVTNGALGATIYLDSYSSAKEYIYYDGNAYEDANGESVAADQSINHAITIVGWDDTISKSNFNSETASRDGAFIIKNSYGEKSEVVDANDLRNILYNADPDTFNQANITEAALIPDDFLISYVAYLYQVAEEKVTIEDNNTIYVEIGNKGYQYVSYDDVHICNNVVGFSNIDNEIEDNNYSYTSLGFSGTVTATGNEVYLLNYFSKTSSNKEYLKEISLFFTKPNQKYTIYFADKKTANISEAIEIATGNSEYYGYDTIEISNNIEITNEDFTVFIKLEDSENVVLPITYKPTFSFNSSYSSFVPTEGVQYISLDATEYADVGVSSGLNSGFNFPINVYTDFEANDVNTPNEDEENNDSETPPTEDEENSDTETPPTEDEENNDTETPTEDEENNDSETPPIKDEDINTDGKIEIEENDYNKENQTNNNVDKPIPEDEVPQTGINYPLLIVIGICLLSGIIYYILKNKNKVFKI